MLKNILGIVALLCLAIAIAHFLTPSHEGAKRQHQSAREQQTLADAIHNRR